VVEAKVEHPVAAVVAAAAVVKHVTGDKPPARVTNSFTEIILTTNVIWRNIWGKFRFLTKFFDFGKISILGKFRFLGKFFYFWGKIRLFTKIFDFCGKFQFLTKFPFLCKFSFVTKKMFELY